ncbi:hypothetical protein [Microbacterium rhizomatis]|uniref:Uncharacterized protein n=1 Tax=Microbacterium rhizomatis TaxID=1631477 RepID=A0A5J5J076_9MICO|nr:hypothetical protein [Microbacterium rhizomatis]KAA9108052.1 hypothetical protein F6B43_11595 [Microbacterium rhizomatis]
MDELPNASDLGHRLRATMLRDFGRLVRSDFDMSWGSVSRIDIGRDECPIPAVMGFALRLAGLDCFGPEEKVAWWVPFVREGVRYEVAHQKFGLRLRIAGDGLSEPEIDSRLMLTKKKLISATKVVEKGINKFTDKLVDSGDATVVNQHSRLQRAYDYFRERALNPTVVEDEHRSFEPGGDLGISGWSFKSGAAVMQVNSTHDVVAAITAFLSRLEHDLVLALPFARFDPVSDHLIDFIGQRWGLKYERVLGKTGRSKHYLEKLIDVIERWRNTYTHGGFEKGNETTVYAHVPDVGALPIGLSSMRGRSFLSLPNASDVTIRDVFSLFDEFDEWFATAATEASAWIESGLDVRFDTDFRNLVDSLAGDPEKFRRYIDYGMYEVDQAANMDF